MRKALIYTDGSANNNSGDTGYGVHIVILDEDVKPKNVFTKYGLTDMGYLLKPEIKKDKELNEVGLYRVYEIYGYNKESTTNNQAELDAIKQAYKAIVILNEKDDLEVEEVTILADSTYCLNFINKMLKETFFIEDVKANVDEVDALYKDFLYAKQHFSLKIGKVPAHSENLGNDRADLLANMGRQRYLAHDEQAEYLLDGGIDFWKLPVLDVDIFHFKQLIRFYPDDADNNVYYGLNYKSESDIGKKVNDVVYTVLELPQPDQLVQDIITKVRETLKDFYVPYILNMQNMTNKKNLFDYLKYGEHVVTIVYKPYVSVMTLTGVELAKELYPTGLSRKVMGNMDVIRNEVDTYVRDGPTKEQYIDITDLIYETSDKDKNIIKKEIINDKFKLSYKLEYAKLNIRLRYDLPPRNLLKKLESKEPKVVLAIRDAGPMYIYKTIVIANDGSLLYTNNYYSNRVIKKIRKGKK